MRPMLTIPLGIKARLDADAEGTLEFLGTGGGGLSETKQRACNRNRRFGDGAPWPGMLRERGFSA